jgi:hypothetical protein
MSHLESGRSIVAIHSHGTESHISLVLLGMRGRPSSEFREVGEGRVVIIMSIPEW